MLRLALTASFAFAVTALVLASAPAGATVEIDVSADTYHIVDGDTFDAFPVGRIRLADIDAPESYEAGFTEATDALAGWVDGRQVFLDVDDDGVEDSYRRLVAVVYVRLDATHLVNVNEALMEDGFAVESDYSNQFDPSTWTRVVDLSAEDLPPYYNDVLDLVLALRGDLATAQASAATSQALANAKTQELADAQHALAKSQADLAVSQAAAADLAARVAAAEAASGPSAEQYAAALQERDSARAELNAANETLKANEASYQATVGAAASSATMAWVVAVFAAGAAVAAFLLGRRSAR
jgi:endonuclease YncB( thermonuclease family)